MAAPLFLLVVLAAIAIVVAASAALRAPAAALLALSIAAFATFVVLQAVSFQGFECDRADCDPTPTGVTVAKYATAVAWIAFGIGAGARYVSNRPRLLV